LEVTLPRLWSGKPPQSKPPQKQRRGLRRSKQPKRLLVAPKSINLR
jgi:hypothetical protein